MLVSSSRELSGAEHEHPRSTTSRSRHTVGVIPGNDRPIPSLHVTHLRSLGVVFLGFDTTHCVSRVYSVCVCVCEWRVLRGLVNSPKDSGTKNMATSVASFFFFVWPLVGWRGWPQEQGLVAVSAADRARLLGDSEGRRPCAAVTFRAVEAPLRLGFPCTRPLSLSRFLAFSLAPTDAGRWRKERQRQGGRAAPPQLAWVHPSLPRSSWALLTAAKTQLSHTDATGFAPSVLHTRTRSDNDPAGADR